MIIIKNIIGFCQSTNSHLENTAINITYVVKHIVRFDFFFTIDLP